MMQRLTRVALLGWALGVLVWAIQGSAAGDEEKKVDLQVGDAAPAFEALDEAGQKWKSADHVGKKYLVVYFYPGDFTPGCIRQAQSFRDNMNKLTDQGVEVIGISGDAVATHALFKQAQKINFTLLSDEDGSLAKKFGVPVGAGGQVKTKDGADKPVTLKRAVTESRWTFILGKDGKILYKNTKVNPVDDSKQVAAFIEKLEKK